MSGARSRTRRAAALALFAIAFGGVWAGRAGAQATPRLVINEVLPENGEVMPFDVGGGAPDLLEIYNDSDEVVVLGTGDKRTSYFLSDSLLVDPETGDPVFEDCTPGQTCSFWQFPERKSIILPHGRLVIFCDNNILQAQCELHANFQIASDGTEPVTLWGPEGEDGKRPVVDRVWLPPLQNNVSFGRSPDGAGPAPVPFEETYDHFVFNPLGSASPPTFGECTNDPIPDRPTVCMQVGGRDRTCLGGANGPGDSKVAPRVEREGHSTNSPAAGEPVEITVRVRDDREPTPGNITKVELRYRVDGGEVQSVALEYDAATGILYGENSVPRAPTDRWTLWSGTIPGQPAGARVEFHYFAEDQTGLSRTEPADLCETVCPECIGPCDVEFGGPRCELDEDDITCEGGGNEEEEGEGAGAGAVIGQRYIACDAWYTYTSGYEPQGPLASLVINEVVPAQDGLLTDTTEGRCVASDLCGSADPDCCKKLEDFIELYNGSDTTISLEGMWLTDSYFQPRTGWQFPAGSKIGAGEHLIVWLDDDGGRCPDPRRPSPPCFWECPDPTAPDRQEYHTNFAISVAGDQIYLVDTLENGLGIIHGLSYSDGGLNLDVQLNQSISLLPDGSRSGCFVITPEPTPRAANVGQCGNTEPVFRRGDANNDCRVDLTDGVYILNFLFLGASVPACPDAADADDSGSMILTDAVYVLNFLFLGGPDPAPPGPETLGTDATADLLDACTYDPDCS